MPARRRCGGVAVLAVAALSAFTVFAPAVALGAADAGEIAACRSVADATERAHCYDRLFGEPTSAHGAASSAPGGASAPHAGATPANRHPVAAEPADTEPATAEPVTAEPAVAEPAVAEPAVAEPEVAEPASDTGALARDAADIAGSETSSDLAVRWELDRDTNRGLWLPRGHDRTYILPARWTSAVNDAPRSPTQPAPDAPPSYRPLEANFQLSLKLKALDDVLGTRTDVWIGYTQQSHWQVYDRAESRPFRETNYAPELFATVPLRIPMLGFTARLLNVGVVHQSNGQSDPRSRSWNRVYAQLGFERGPFVLLVKPWLRLPERDRVDNNPDIMDYVGRGEVHAIWSRGRQTVSLQIRNSFHDAWRGSARLHWSFPLIGNLKGYVQIFDGYGESLIDYNHSQTTVGLGVLVVDVM